MGGRETVAATAGDEQVHVLGLFQYLAWAKPHYVFFDQLAADAIGQGDTNNHCQEKDKAFLFKIQSQKNQQEQIEGYPGEFISQDGQEEIKKWVLATGVDEVKKLVVELKQLCQVNEKMSR